MTRDQMIIDLYNIAKRYALAAAGCVVESKQAMARAEEYMQKAKAATDEAEAIKNGTAIAWQEKGGAE